MNFVKSLSGKQRRSLAVMAVILVLAFILMLRDAASFGVDDSYIFFRYAENVAQGEGFVFNAGEPAGEGFTSWVWTLMLTLFHYTGLDMVLVSKVLGVLFHVLGGVFVFLLARQISGKDAIGAIIAAILTTAFLLNYRLVAHSVSGMETSLYICSLVLLAYLTTLALQAPAAQAKWWLTISLTTLGLFLVRPEGIAAGGMSLLALAIHQRKNLFKPKTWFYVIIGLVAPLALFIIMKLLVFGYPLPHSFYHKLIVMDREYAESFRQFWLFLQAYWWLVLLAIATALFTIIKRKQYLFVYYGVLFIAMTGLYLFFYPAMNYLDRFYIPYLPLLLLMIEPVLRILAEKLNRLRPAWVFPLGLIMAAAILVVGINPGLHSVQKKVKSWALMVNPDMYRAKLGKIMSTLPAEIVVANSEMGVIPYYSRLTCIDMAGLTDPYIAHHGLSLTYLEERKVDLILFSRDVAKISTPQWNKYTLNYKAVFLSRRFKEDFQCIGAFNAWPGSDKKYYLYADKMSPHFADIRQWQQKYAAELEL